MSNKKIVISIVALLLMFFIIVINIFNIKTISTASALTYGDKLFQKKGVTNINIEIDETDFNDMIENPLEEEYKKASITVNDVTVNNVAIRTKGNSSLTSVSSSDSNRYSFKIDLDYYESGQNLYGLKKLNLNNNVSDASSMREYLSYSLMEEMGVPTPEYGYMYITVNGEDFGLYLGVEAIDENFLINNFENSLGDLYKPDGTGSDLNYISDNISDYSGLNLKTNEGSSDGTEILSMIKAINDKENIEEYLNLDEIIRYFAVSTALVNLDSYQGSTKHNYYLYEDNGVFSVLPWDMNMSFGGFSMGGEMGKGGENIRENAKNNDLEESNSKSDNGNADNVDQNKEPPNIPNGDIPENNGMQMGENGEGMGGIMSDSSRSAMSDSMINLPIDTPVSGTSMLNSPLITAWLDNDEYKETYHKYLEEIAKGFLSEERMRVTVAELYSLLLPYVESDPTKFFTVEEFTSASIDGENSLINFSKQRGESILKQLSGELESQSEDAYKETTTGQGAMGGGQMPNMGDGNGRNNNIQNNNGENGMNNMQGERPDIMGENNKVPKNQGNRNDGGPGMEGNGSESTIKNLVIYGISIVLFILAMIFVGTFKRRGRGR